MVGLGLYGDGHGWWDERSFATNLASSFASLFFGVPLALLVLSHLGAQQGEVVERRAAQRQARRMAAKFWRAFDERGMYEALTSPPDSSMLFSSRLGEMASAVDAMAALLDFPPESREFRTGELHSIIQELVRLFDSVGPADIEVWSANLARQWAMLDDEARPSAEAAGLHWMRSEDILTLEAALQVLQSPSILTLLGSPFPATAHLLATQGNVDEARRILNEFASDVEQAQIWMDAAIRVHAMMVVELPTLGILWPSPSFMQRRSLRRGGSTQQSDTPQQRLPPQ
ncbi:hypothetical protein [Streptomyces erythrochromogenes]|uniref:hypothetical protein n=1 Tax=Streptomyces erythrochromogenes TaxID=285574 RepID=UPI00367496A7